MMNKKALSLILGVFLVLAFAGYAEAAIDYGGLPANFDNATLDMNATRGAGVGEWNESTGYWDMHDFGQITSTPMIGQKVAYNTTINITTTSFNMNISKLQYAVQDKRVANIYVYNESVVTACTYAETNTQGWKVYNCTLNLITVENTTMHIGIIYNVTGITATWSSENMFGSNKRKALYNVTYVASRMNITNATLYVVPIHWHTNVKTSHPWTVGSNISDISTGIGYANGYTSNSTGAITYSGMNNSNMSYWLEVVYDVTAQSVSHGRSSTGVAVTPLAVTPGVAAAQVTGIVAIVVAIIIVIVSVTVVILHSKGMLKM